MRAHRSHTWVYGSPDHPQTAAITWPLTGTSLACGLVDRSSPWAPPTKLPVGEVWPLRLSQIHYLSQEAAQEVVRAPRSVLLQGKIMASLGDVYIESEQ